MGGELDDAINFGHVEVVEIGRIARRRGCHALSWAGGLSLIEGVQRTTTRVAQQDDVLVATRTERLDRGGHIEGEFFVDGLDIVVQPARVVAEGGEAGFDQSGNRVVARAVGARDG